jgi:hypothetical protein
MIHFFNRRELSRTFDPEELARLRNALEIHNVPYKIQIRTDRGFGGMGRNGRGGILPGANPTLGTQYTIYIHRSDFDRAMHYISKI